MCKFNVTISELFLISCIFIQKYTAGIILSCSTCTDSSNFLEALFSFIQQKNLNNTLIEVIININKIANPSKYDFIQFDF